MKYSEIQLETRNIRCLGYQTCFGALLRKRNGGGGGQTTKMETACNDFCLFSAFCVFLVARFST